MTTRATISLDEYKSARAPSGPPSAGDLRLAALLAGRDVEPRLTVRWLAGNEIDVTASSWVGVVRFSRVEIRVLPKLVGGPLRVLRMLEYSSGPNLLKRLPTHRPLPSDGDDLFELICVLLAEETKALVGDGLLRDYRPVEESLQVLRGRLRHRDQYLRRYGQLQPLECSFDEYDSDVPENQLLAAALRVARNQVHGLDVKLAISRLVTLFDDACHPPTSDPDWYERVIQYDRRNARYRPAHELALLVLRHVAFHDIYNTRAGHAQVSAFMIDMNIVFERFVTRLVHDSLVDTNLVVTPQSSIRTVIHNDATNQPYGAIRPDLMIFNTQTGRRAPIDVKYKLYDAKKVSPGDIYQLFLYAYALGEGDSPHHAGLLYPADRPINGPLLSIRPIASPPAARITGAGLDVPRALDSIGTGDVTSLQSSVRELVSRVTGL